MSHFHSAGDTETWNIIAFRIPPHTRGSPTVCYRITLTLKKPPTAHHTGDRRRLSTESKVSDIIFNGKFDVSIGVSSSPEAAYNVAGEAFLDQTDQNSFLKLSYWFGFGLTIVQDYDTCFLEKTLYVYIRNNKLLDQDRYTISTDESDATMFATGFTGSHGEFFKGKLDAREKMKDDWKLKGGLGLAAGAASSYFVHTGGSYLFNHEAFQYGGTLDIGGIEKRDRRNRKKYEISDRNRDARIRQERENTYALRQGHLNARDFIKSDEDGINFHEEHWRPREHQRTQSRAEKEAFTSETSTTKPGANSLKQRGKKKQQENSNIWTEQTSQTEADGGANNHEDEIIAKAKFRIRGNVEKTNSDLQNSKFGNGNLNEPLSLGAKPGANSLKRRGKKEQQKNSDIWTEQTSPTEANDHEDEIIAKAKFRIRGNVKKTNSDLQNSKFGNGNLNEPLSFGAGLESTGEFGASSIEGDMAIF